jgi:AcrR family transcriptional regulator
MVTDPEVSLPAPVRMPRKRRSTATVRELILETARAVFSARGFARTTIRDVADEADVTTATIFRQFGSKANLFEEAIAEPYGRFVSEYIDSWESFLPGVESNEALVRGFVTSFYDFVLENKDLIAIYSYVTRFESDVFQSAAGESVLSRELKRVEDWIRRDGEKYGFYDLDIPLTLRCCCAVVIGVVIHEDLLLPAMPLRPTRERLIREMTTLILKGVSARRSTSALPPAGGTQ